MSSSYLKVQNERLFSCRWSPKTYFGINLLQYNQVWGRGFCHHQLIRTAWKNPTTSKTHLPRIYFCLVESECEPSEQGGVSNKWSCTEVSLSCFIADSQHSSMKGTTMCRWPTGRRIMGQSFIATKHNSNGLLSAARSGGRKMTEMNLENKIIRIIY